MGGGVGEIFYSAPPPQELKWNSPNWLLQQSSFSHGRATDYIAVKASFDSIYKFDFDFCYVHLFIQYLMAQSLQSFLSKAITGSSKLSVFAGHVPGNIEFNLSKITEGIMSDFRLFFTCHIHFNSARFV